MVLGALTVLTVFLTELQQETSSQLSAALSERDAMVAEYHAKSAVNLARLLIATEPTVRKAVTPLFMMMKKPAPQIPIWEFADLLLAPYNGGGAEEASASAALAASLGVPRVDPEQGKNLGLEGGRFVVKIVDEDSKLNVNSAARGDAVSLQRLSAQLYGLFAPVQFDTFFESPDPDGQTADRMTLCAALVDWADSDENLFFCDPRATGPGNQGVEDNIYQSIGLDYRRKNAAYDSLEELRLVRGVGDDFWATFVDPDPLDPGKRIMTVWGQGAVNVNTANAQTLLAVICAGAPDSELCLDPTQTESFLVGVNLAKGIVQGAPLFATPKDFINTMKGKGLLGPVLGTLGVKPIAFKSDAEMAKTVSTESKIFSIYAEGIVSHPRRETRVRVHTVVDFRQSQSLSSLSAGPSGFGAADPASGALPPAPGASADGTITPESLLGAIHKDPAGTVLYHRVE